MYEIPSGVQCTITKGEDYSTRRQFVTRKRLKFAAYVRATSRTYQFEHAGWLLVVPAVEVVVEK